MIKDIRKSGKRLKRAFAVQDLLETDTVELLKKAEWQRQEKC